MYAVAKGNLELINLLLDAGADVRAVDMVKLIFIQPF